MLQIELLKVFNNYLGSSLKVLAAVTFVISLTSCQETELYSALSEQQANEVHAALLAKGVEASKQRSETEGMWRINVNRQQFPVAMTILDSAGLPRAKKQSMGEVFPKEGFVSSPLEERARYLHALSQELSNTLMQLDGVVSARVHVALPENRTLTKNEDNASVSVVIIHQPDTDLTIYETDIKAIVTDGIEGMNDINRVTVKFFERVPVIGSLEVSVVTSNAWMSHNTWFYLFTAMTALCGLLTFAFISVYRTRARMQPIASAANENALA